MAISEKYSYCCECKEIFERADLVRGEFGYDECCPCCGSFDIAPCDECECCGEPFIEGELHDGVICEDCLLDHRYDYKELKHISKHWMEYEEISINSLLKHIFTESEIEDILFEVLEKRIAEGMELDGYSYMARDMSEYCEMIKNARLPQFKENAEFRRAG